MRSENQPKMVSECQIMQGFEVVANLANDAKTSKKYL
jgi:hypothetical protein